MDKYPDTENPYQDPVSVIEQFNDALNKHDVDAMMELMTQNCVFENTQPAPQGTRYEGHPALRAFWHDFFGSALDQTIEIEELFGLEDRAVMRWIYRWKDAAGQPAFIRGVDIYCVRDGKIAEKLSYVKG